MRPRGPIVCPGCGVQRASALSACTVCETPYAEPGVAMPADDDYWIAVRCQFQCRSCGHLSPLNHLDLDGSVVCLRCGLDQVFELDQWADGLDHAMRAGTEAGAGDFAGLGVTTSAVELVQSGFTLTDGMMKTRSLRVSAGPGHPLCARCRVPLVHAAEAEGVSSSRCPQCTDTLRCALPPQARSLCGPVRAVIAEELALDRREARIDAPGADGGATPGAIAIKCPQCSAPLKITGASTIVTCEYCQTASRIPSRTLFRLGHDHPVPQVWWLRFSGDAARAAARKRRKAAAPAKPRREPTRPAKREPPARKAPPPPQGPGMLVALGVLAGVGFLGHREVIERWSIEPSAAAPPAHEATAPPSHRAPTPPASPRPARAAPFVALDGCRCGTTQLHVRVTPEGEGAAIQLRADRPRHAPVLVSAVDTAGRRLGIGVACHKDTLALVIGDRAVGWSLANGAQRWDRALGDAYRYDGAEPAEGITLYCRPLATRGARATVPIGATGTILLDLRTGTTRKR